MLSVLHARLLNPVLFRFDPERAHHAFVFPGSALGRTSLGRGLVFGLCCYRGPGASVRAGGPWYSNPVLLVAGSYQEERSIKLAGPAFLR
ncbi:MAG: hypothetical protein EA421_16435 [Gemmatimonadales bacterium]|nr:MAG: hypothetical protein EA421_16435 [Gemmatimonadales bacterium]